MDKPVLLERLYGVWTGIMTGTDQSTEPVMNPFTHSTVARPAGCSRRPWGSPRVVPPALPVRPAPPPPPPPVPPMSPEPCLRAGHRLARVLGAASLVALGWSGGALALDLNTATEAQLKGVRGIGPKTAQIILEERERGGRYESFSDLSDRVKGIGPKKASALQAAGLAIEGGKGTSEPARVLKR